MELQHRHERESPASDDPLLHTYRASCNAKNAPNPSIAAAIAPKATPWKRHLSSAAHAAIGSSMIVYTVAHVGYSSPVIHTWLVDAWANLPWGSSGPNDTILPAYFVAFTVLPFLVSVLLIEAIRDPSTRRVASRTMMQIGVFMRRQPRVLGFTSTVGIGELLFRCVLIGGNALVFWYGRECQTRRYDALLAEGRQSFSSSEMRLQIAGMALGYNCAFNLAFLFLPTTRNCAWMEFLHISYGNGVKYHVALGKLAILMAIAHAVPFYQLWRRQGTLSQNALLCSDCSLEDSSAAWRNVCGELSLFFFLLVGWTSHPKVRRAMFEVFYYTHHLYIIGVVFAVMHWGPLIWWLLPTLLLYLIHRTLSSWNALHAVQVCEFKALPDQIVKLVLARSTASDGSGNFQLGQFVYLNVPAISRLQWHPLTISSSPRASTTTFTILLKSLGGWTQELVAHADGCGAKQQLPTILVDGFYGSSLQAYDKYATVCLVGGGIGATPLFAILEDMAAHLDQLGGLRQRVHFVFAFRELSLLAELVPVLTKLRREEQFTMHLFLTKKPRDDVLDASTDETQHGDASIASAAQPFAEPLRSRSLRTLVYVLVFSSSVLLILWLEDRESKLLESHATTETQSRPLVLLLEITALFVLPFLVVLVLVLERVWKGRCVHKTNTDGYATKDGPVPLKQRCIHDGRIPTLRELLSTFNVTVDQRPNLKQLLTQVREGDVTRVGHATPQPKVKSEDTIGIFFSGPCALRRAAELAVSALGSKKFDLHTEEFEL